MSEEIENDKISKEDILKNFENINMSDLNNEEEEPYLIFINSTKDNPLERNKISTSKYRWNTFFPKMLMEQYSRLANVYFLIIAILQSVRSISYTGQMPLILIPLSVVVILNGIKDLYEDFTRKKSDNEENNKITLVYDKLSKSFYPKKWQDIKLGEIVKVSNEESFPADLLLLKTSDENGICYIETKNIDGETNLKTRQVNKDLINIIKEEKDLANLQYVCVTKQPNEFIYQFNATLYEYEGLHLKNRENCILINEKSFLLRGSRLRQTEYIIGTVIYVGENTKSMLNSPNARSKHSTVEYIMNFLIIFIFTFQIILSIFCSICHLILYFKYRNIHNYIILTDKYNKELKTLNIFIMLSGTWVLIFTNFVPISLLVTLETIKFFQAMFMGFDIDMYDIERDMGAKVQTSTINEELGQVKFVFSDKTGTLTKNYMQYKCMSIGNKVYGDIESSKNKKDNINDKYGIITNVEFDDVNNDFSNDLGKNNELIHHFMICLCLCHSVIIDNKKFEKENKIEYQASSPDEKALIYFARSQDYIFMNKTVNNEIILEIKGERKTYEILNELEYSSERKRMSIICKDLETNKIILYAKGADSMIESLLDSKEKTSEMLNKTNEYLKQFAVKGLRTLMLAYRELSNEEYEKWKEKYVKASQDVIQKDTLILKLYDEIEKNFKLIGSTAIEDQLQDEVDSVIHSLMETGIKVWMLTGDKLDTAKNIAYSCKLFENNMKIIQFDSDKDLETDLKNIINEATFYQKNIVYGLLISSEILSIIFSENKLLKLFYKICNRCLSVVCSRVSPKQKAEMVNLIKTSNKAITLAIGDGANDVGMINEANIGIGIYGLEGTQAARASDYAITQFSHLRKLLFFHGREAYRRNTYVVLYNFYKNIIFLMPMFLYGFVNLFSGLTIYDPFIHQMFNTIYTAIPIGWFGVCDLEFEPSFLVKNPKYYIQGIYGKLFHYRIFWEWVISGFVQAIFLFFIGYYTFRNCDSAGISYDFWVIGDYIYSIIVIIVNFKIVVDTNTHSIYSFTLNAASIASYFLSVLAISKIEKTTMFKTQNFTIAGHWNNVILDFKFIFSIYVGVLFCLSFDVFLRKFMILFGFRIEGDKLPPYFDDSIFIDDIKNKDYNDRSYNEPLINNLI